MTVTEEEREIRLLCDAVHDFNLDKSDLWMESRNRAFGGNRPSDLIEQGRGQEVRSVLDLLLGK